MKPTSDKPVAPGAASAGDAEAIRHFHRALASGQNWYLALLGAMGLWSSAEETRDGRACRYLIGGEAFDWLLLAERLSGTAEGLLPEDEINALIFRGVPPLALRALEVKQYLGEAKYAQYLNYFYGVTVEEAMVQAVQEEIDKERRAGGLRSRGEPSDEPYLRIYGAGRDDLFRRFRQEQGRARLKSASLTDLKEFTYWLFKYRLRQCEKAKIASDTKKALVYLKRHWQQKGVSLVLATDLNPPFPT